MRKSLIFCIWNRTGIFGRAFEILETLRRQSINLGAPAAGVVEPDRRAIGQNTEKRENRVFSKTDKDKDQLSAHADAVLAASRGRETSVVGADITVMGDIDCQGDVRIFGAVVGDVSGRVLIVEECGQVEGNLTGERIHICGEVIGTVTAADVSLTKSAQVVGNVTHSELYIEPGATHEGRRPWRPRGNMAKLSAKDVDR